MKPFNIMIVDDSKFMRDSVIRLFENDKIVNVTDTAPNGLEALNILKTGKPIDVVIMDIEMPVMDGVEAVKIIMREKPTPIIMLSALAKEHSKTVEALMNGAFDFIRKPGGKSISFDMSAVKDELIEKIKYAVIANLTERLRLKKGKSIEVGKISRYFDFIVIGASTGGPGTLAKIFKILPHNFDIPVAVVQHIKEGYSASLAEGLNTVSAVNISEVNGFTDIKGGNVYIAKAGYHLEVAAGGNQLKLTKAELRNGFRPSVDVLFETALDKFKGKILGIVLTGMGNDGAAGAEKLLKAGHSIIVQDEATSIVWGMPRVIYEAGNYTAVLSIDEIARTINGLKHTP